MSIGGHRRTKVANTTAAILFRIAVQDFAPAAILRYRKAIVIAG
jgi:hypothetical protein